MKCWEDPFLQELKGAKATESAAIVARVVMAPKVDALASSSTMATWVQEL
jgi:hypothetical protein